MKIPTLNQQVELQPIPNAKLQSGVTPVAFGVNVGPASEQMGKTIQTVGDQIMALKNKPHDVVYQTTVAEVSAQMADNVANSGADFAIVTDPAHQAGG